MKTPTAGAIAVMSVSALLAAGCGSGKKSSTTSAAATAPAASTQASTPPPAAATGTQITVKRAGALGTILAAGAKKMTVYLFQGDRGSVSSCSGACASAWPPVTTAGAPAALHGAAAADLGTTRGSGGVTQVTYKGHPLYYFVKDKDSGDSYGEGVKAFGADWYAVSPKGSKVDNS